MDIVLKFIKENNSIIMAALFIIIIILTAIVIITDIINKKKNKLSMLKLLNDSESNMTDAFNERIIEDNSLYYTNDLSEYTDVLTLQPTSKEEIEEIKYVDEDDELEKTKAQIELKNLKEELLKAEAESKIEMEESIQKEEVIIPTKDEILDQFELNQEENAIISLDEFNKISDRVYEENEEIQYKDEGNEPISIQELEALYNIKESKPSNDNVMTLETKDEKLEELDSIKEPVEPLKITDAVPTKFKNSPIISPVFGIDSNTTDNIEVENTANLDKLSEEIKKTTEVLNTLKELRKNL